MGNGELVLTLRRDLAVTSVVVTHDMKSAYKIADGDADADAIRNHPHPTVQPFIHGEVSDEDLALLGMSEKVEATQLTPKDFEPAIVNNDLYPLA